MSMQTILDSVATALQEVMAHKLRSALTLIGISLGVLALVVVLSLRIAVTAAIRSDFDALGYDGLLRVSPQLVIAHEEVVKQHYSRGLRREDAVALQRHTELIAAVAPMTFSTQRVTSRDAVVRSATIIAVTGSHTAIRGRSIAQGRPITDADDRSVAAVCVLGSEMATRLFPKADPVGRTIAIGDHRFVVVGVGTKLSSIFIDSETKTREMGGVYVPLSTHRSLFSEVPLNFNLLVKARDPNRTVEAEREIRRRLLALHGGIHDVTVTNVGAELLRERVEVERLLRNWSIVFIVIASVSLFLGGIGVFSVLQIAVAERVYEIGLRKSVGASDGAIFAQFLTESCVLAALGALAGSVLAGVLIVATRSYYPAGLALSPQALSLSNVFAIVTGALAGIYPAAVAARLEPVEALRAA